MPYKLTNFRSIVIKPFYTNPQIDLISTKTHQAILTRDSINPAGVINKAKELATSTRATRPVVEIPFYRHKENLEVFSTKKEEANLQLSL